MNTHDKKEILFIIITQTNHLKLWFPYPHPYTHLFLPLDLLLEAETGAGLDAFETTLEALDDGVAEAALLPAVDLTLSSALF